MPSLGVRSLYLEYSDCPIKKNICFCLSDDVSISSARIKQSDGRGIFSDISGWFGDTVETLGPLIGSESTENQTENIGTETIGIVGNLVGDTVGTLGSLVGSEFTKNIGIVVKLVGKLIENTAFSTQSYDSSFKLRRIPIYRLIYTVQNEQIMLAEPGVEPIQMNQSEFLDAKHIRLVFFVCHKTSDVISQ